MSMVTELNKDTVILRYLGRKYLAGYRMLNCGSPESERVRLRDEYVRLSYRFRVWIQQTVAVLTLEILTELGLHDMSLLSHDPGTEKIHLFYRVGFNLYNWPIRFLCLSCMVNFQRIVKFYDCFSIILRPFFGMWWDIY